MSYLRRISPQKTINEYAIEVLFERYEEFKGKSAFDICKGFGIVVQEDEKLPSSAGEFRPDLFVIKISKKADLPEMKEFVAFHELAHFFLRLVGISFNEDDAEYWACESWCDNFAFAMLLARFGRDAICRESALEFFEQGSEIPRGRGKNTHIALRFFASCKGGAWADHESELPSLFRLAVKFLEK